MSFTYLYLLFFSYHTLTLLSVGMESPLIIQVDISFVVMAHLVILFYVCITQT